MITDVLFDSEFDNFHFAETHQYPPKRITHIREERTSPPRSPDIRYSNSSQIDCDRAIPKERNESKHKYIYPKCSKHSLEDELTELLAKHEPNFYDYLIGYMNLKHIDNEADLYKKAEVDRKVFSKIRSMRETNHRPSKPTALKLCLALELTSQQTQEMLNTVGHGMSNASMVDKIIMFYIEHNEFDIFRIDKKILDMTHQRYLIENL